MAAIRILGLDPGLRKMGWGVVAADGVRLSHVAHGVVRPPTDAALAVRLGVLYAECAGLVARFAPDEAAMEETFVNDNPRSALLLGQARGAALAAFGTAGLSVQEFAPAKIKKTVTGAGRADKDQIAFMVARLLPAAHEATQDAADALAIAITAASHRPARRWAQGQVA